MRYNNSSNTTWKLWKWWTLWLLFDFGFFSHCCFSYLHSKTKKFRLALSNVWLKMLNQLIYVTSIELSSAHFITSISLQHLHAYPLQFNRHWHTKRTVSIQFQMQICVRTFRNRFCNIIFHREWSTNVSMAMHMKCILSTGSRGNTPRKHATCILTVLAGSIHNMLLKLLWSMLMMMFGIWFPLPQYLQAQRKYI